MPASPSTCHILPPDVDGQFMLKAVESATTGVVEREGGPFGAAIVKNGEIVAVTHNTVLKCKDPTNHAEMNCIREACKALGTHDLSDCDLYTTCEPCPMCWGACNWARIRRLMIGVDRTTAAEFGFDDEFFYQELDQPKHERSVKHLEGIMKDKVTEVFKNSATYKRKRLGGGGMFAEVFERMFSEDVEAQVLDVDRHPKALNEFMQIAIDTALEGMSDGGSKEREPFAAVVVKDGKVISKAHNTVMSDHDATATAEINAIREACRALDTYVLEGCEMYSTAEPDPMSLGAIYWSRISTIHVGVSQKLAALFGFEDGILHYKELAADRGNRVVETIDDVEFAACEGVFKKWKQLGGDLY